MKINVLYVIKNFTINGISTVVLNYSSFIDKNKFNIIIYTGKPVDDINLKKCEENGIKVIVGPDKDKNRKSYYQKLNKLIKKEKIDIFHIHGNSRLVFVELFIAKINGCKIRIVHCHSTKCNHLIINKLLTPIFNLMYTEGFACSNDAGKWLFGRKKFTVINNGFNIENFKFNPIIRKKIRNDLGLQDSFLIGHVGNFNEAKNQIYLIDIINEIRKKKDYIKLILIGNGSYYDILKRKIDEYNLSNNVILLGKCSDVYNYYSSFDLFVFPSKYEGFGLSLLEAQINGLPCITSDVIPNEAVIIKDFEKLSLNEPIEKWAKTILKYVNKKSDRENIYSTYYKQFKKYDILQNVKDLESIYKNISK